MGLEYVGLKGIGKFIAGKTGTFGPLVSMGLTQNKEGLTEVGQVGIESFNNSIAKGISFREATNIAFDKMTSKEGIESYAMGFVASGGITAPSAFSKMMVTEGENRGKVQGYINTLGELQVQRNSNNDPAFRKSMDIQIESVENSFKDFINNSYNLSKALNKEQQAEILSLIDKKSTNNKTLKELTSSYRKGKMSGQQYGSAKGALINSNKALNNKIIKVQSEANLEVIEKETKKIDAGATAVAEQLEVGIETFDTTEDTAGAIETLKNQGGKVDVKNSTDYGTIVEIPNDQGGIDTQIIINKQEAAADNVVTTSQHEVLHAVLSKTTKGNPDATIALGKSLLNELRSDGVNLGGEFEARLDQYVKDPNISEADVMEEVMTLASEGLTNGEITINESTLTKIGNAIKKFFGLNDLNIKFNTGKDVLNFIKDYNKSVQKGKGLTKGQLEVATEGAKGKLIDNAEVEAKTIVTKQSKKLPAETETYMELDNDMLQQGLNDAIQNKTDQQFPIAQAVVEKNWPLISKSLDINSQQEMDAAKLNAFLFEKGITLSHLVQRKESLEEKFLALTQNPAQTNN